MGIRHGKKALKKPTLGLLQIKYSIIHFVLKNNMKKPLLYFYCLTMTFNLFSQIDTQSELFKTIKEKDSLLFNIGFNTCNMKQFENLVSDSVEMYHDQSGTILSKSVFMENTKNGLCKMNYKAKRVLVEGSMQVFPMYNKGVLYGAIQSAKHQFYAIEPNKPEYLTSEALFTHLWLLENGQWKLGRILSFDHKNPDKLEKNPVLFKDKDITEKWMAEKGIPALGIGYIRGGKMEQISVFGDLEKGRPAPKNTIWNVASLTKPITAMVTLKLVNEGKWDLDEPVFNYWTDPDIADDPRHKLLTTRMLLSHQSGFPNWRWNNKSKKLAFDFDPGKKYQYSGEGMEYLKHALEKKFNKTLGKLAQELIFTPLEMTDSRLIWDDKMDETRFAKWHNKKGELYETTKRKEASAADDLLTTIEDYSKFMVHIINGAGLKPELFKDLTTHQVKTKDGKFFGLGLELYDFGNKEYGLTHGGSDQGVRTIAFMFPQRKEGLVIFTNSDTGGNAYEPVVVAYLKDLGKKIIDIEMK